MFLLNASRLGAGSRLFSSAGVQFAKKRGQAAKEAVEVDLVDVGDYVKKATERFQHTVELHKKRLGQMKAGKPDATMFDGLAVGNEKQKFTELAATSVKGKNMLIVTVFDPKDTKRVASAIVGAGLNVTTERVLENQQQLKISLPPVTTETRERLCRDMKKVFEEYKNSANRHSLGHVRSEVLKELKKLDKKNDSVRKVIQEIENLHKEYTAMLQEQLKHAEKNAMR
ncbi:AAL074Cp [Eremothecium gossypii ATCC 10895]|uniref:Ribosome-recycling factor, mitochondrial n=1 Tax=Eremothecium gossypii (strain ATCC 10895 / CBS 109.51 / FGSC 9923 / NRRL Y-1056) TaxID=284811 RepID=RRF1_EREGS|nr:AAL074Cp [Eremothecium gossypii ATCC 10895]Q75F02.1 RecName: Full=Ribosome-recycling factor, mitochondrial; Short=RRF; AltName: Full=Ribosome-releasing factor, mitochondrial; Flags: Precursor [Eremothecium gossypii ATCC 10895]AAS50292.1 AAL074Cp [Eremothecium gossypii ATCC 10895]AEY94578.1 FAAL074Cp [Eremothecium gossypii FDAG1]